MRFGQITRRWSGWALIALAGGGCDGIGSPAPGPPPAVPVTATPMVALILPAEGSEELDIWEAAARREMQRTKTLTDVRRLEPGDPPEKQAEQIRQAIVEGASALIVMASDPQAVAPALEEARSQGIPVVLLDRAVTLSGTPAPLVSYASDRETAKAIVDACVADAKDLGFPAEGPAVILINARSDDHAHSRVQALRNELDSRGIRVIPDISYDGLVDQAKEAFKEAFPAMPHLAMLFAEDDIALKAAAGFRHSLDRTQRRFVLAGYTHERRTMELVQYNVASAIVDRNMNEPIRRAFDTALAMIRGETVSETIGSPTPITRALGKEKEGLVPAFLSMPEKMANSDMDNESGGIAIPDDRDPKGKP